MAIALITLTTAGADTGPFDLYSDVTGYVTSFESGISKSALLAGYTSSSVPAGTTTIRVKSTSVSCSNYVDIAVGGITTTSTTTTTTSIPPNSVLYNDSNFDISLKFNLYGKVGSLGTYQLIYAEPTVVTIPSGDYYEFYQSAYPGAFSSTSNVYFRIDIASGSNNIYKGSPLTINSTRFYLDKWSGSTFAQTTTKLFSADSPATTASLDSWSGNSPNAVFGISVHLADVF